MSGKVRKTGKAVFVANIVTGASVAKAAKAARICERQAYRWLRRPEVIAEITEARARMIDSAVAKLATAAAAAADTLQKLLKDESESVRLSAARSLLELAFGGCEITNLERRLESLEDHARANKAPEPTNSAA